jgi:hypothetical protein
MFSAPIHGSARVRFALAAFGESEFGKDYSMINLQSEHKEAIEEIISQIQCLKGFCCYESGFEHLGEVKDIGLESFLECFEKECQTCPFCVPFASRHLCQCRLRIYVARRLGV